MNAKAILKAKDVVQQIIQDGHDLLAAEVEVRNSAKNLTGRLGQLTMFIEMLEREAEAGADDA